MAFILWLTGLPCSGKTTISKKLQDFISNLAVLDGDELREWLSPKSFSQEDVISHNKKVAHLAKLLSEHQVPVCVALISPYKKNREDARDITKNDNFIEVFLKCSVEECEKRDVKGMYKKARDGIIKDFIGLDNRYEIPNNPELVLDTENFSIDECVNKIITSLKEKELLLDSKS